MQVVWKVALVAALFGCGDKDETEVMDDTAVVTTSTTEPTEPPRDVDHLQVQAIMDANCGPCHLDGNIEAGLTLSNVLSLIARPASQSGLRLVEPGDSSRSYLLFKLRGEQVLGGGSGKQMPRDSQPLSDYEIETIAVWIDEGCTIAE